MHILSYKGVWQGMLSGIDELDNQLRQQHFFSGVPNIGTIHFPSITNGRSGNQHFIFEQRGKGLEFRFYSLSNLFDIRFVKIL